jgi:hypothetical protein
VVALGAFDRPLGQVLKDDLQVKTFT